MTDKRTSLKTLKQDLHDAKEGWHDHFFDNAFFNKTIEKLYRDGADLDIVATDSALVDARINNRKDVIDTEKQIVSVQYGLESDCHTKGEPFPKSHQKMIEDAKAYIETLQNCSSKWIDVSGMNPNTPFTNADNLRLFIHGLSRYFDKSVDTVPLGINQ